MISDANSQAQISVYCSDCDSITDHSIDFFGDEEWWACNVCNEPYAKACTGQPSEISHFEFDQQPNYDPFADDPIPLLEGGMA